MKLIRDLQRDILNDSTSLSSALRKAKVVAAKIKNPDFKAWVEAELNGYADSALDLPSYRVLNAPSFGYFSGPFGSAIKNQVIPVLGFPDWLQEYATHVRFGNGVRELEELASSEGLQRRWQAEAVQLANQHIESDYVLVDASQPISTAGIQGILDAVRNRLLEFLLELQDIDPGILDNEDALGTLPQEKVASSFNLTFYGNQNVVSAAATGGTSSQQVFQSVLADNAGSLLTYLRSLKVPDADIAELEAALAADGKPSEKGAFGPRVRRWIGGMTEKVLAGTWKVALEAGPTLLTKALAAYYGWEGK